ncbi:MAG: hypothetical protein NTZ78_09945 [Candidatus Aureabacteria bacterium]|nr:hypothetical protein [Candidatus Auribacterota bacterium]
MIAEEIFHISERVTGPVVYHFGRKIADRIPVDKGMRSSPRECGAGKEEREGKKGDAYTRYSPRNRLKRDTACG